MVKIVIHRGSHQIGGCCTEISTGQGRILIDFGANLPGVAGPVSDDDLVKKVLGSVEQPPAAILFTHYHGDHVGLADRSELAGIPMYIGPVAKEMQRVRAKWTHKSSEQVDAMRVYTPGKPFSPLDGLSVQPFYVDHSALDSYMFLITAGSQRILYTGDFRSHGVQGDSLWRLSDCIASHGGISALITEATMFGEREKEVSKLSTEEDLGKRAAALFRQHKYNFVLVSSTNIDTIMQMYHNTLPEQHFVCDLYQAEMLLTALRFLQEREAAHARRLGRKPHQRAESQGSAAHPMIRILGPETDEWQKIRMLGAELESPISVAPVMSRDLFGNGFVMLVRKNAHRDKWRTVFEKCGMLFGLWTDRSFIRCGMGT